VPQDQFETASHIEDETHVITLNNGTAYAARRFSVTDSTVVILKLKRTVDAHTSEKVPVTLRRQDIKSVQRLELDRDRSFFLLVGTGLLAALVAAMATFEIPSS
jgi:hypothetical protein